jgi:hypothetical protein
MLALPPHDNCETFDIRISLRRQGSEEHLNKASLKLDFESKCGVRRNRVRPFQHGQLKAERFRHSLLGPFVIALW